MKRLLYTLLIAMFVFSFCFIPVSFSQIGIVNPIVTPIQTGFVVITPLQGDGQGLSVSETFGQQVAGNLFQASVLSSPTVTLTDIFVNVNPATGTDTGVAIVNPNVTGTTVNLRLANNQGTTVATQNITIGALQQVSRFVTQLFAGVPQVSGPFSGLLFISSDIPVGVMGLVFVGPSFTSLPVASQLNPSVTTNTGVSVTSTAVVATAGVNNTATSNPVTTTGIILPTTITQIPSTVIGLPPTSVATGPAQSVIGIPAPGTTTTTGQTTTVINNGTTVSEVVVTSVSNSSSIITNGGLLLPQFATGGGWSSQIVIANTSGAAQLVRVDLFTSDGTRVVSPLTSTLTSIVVPAGGVVTFSTAT